MAEWLVKLEGDECDLDNLHVSLSDREGRCFVRLAGGRRGRQTVDLRITGIAAFLAAKAAALRGRDKPKDAYDVVWLLEAWTGGPAGAARAVRAAPVFSHPEMRRALETLEDQFRDIDRAGARACARFVADADTDPDLLSRRAVGAVREFLQGVGRDDP